MLSWAGIAMTHCTTTRNIPDGIPVIQMHLCAFCRSPVARFHLNRTPCSFSLNFSLPLKKSAHATFYGALSKKPGAWGFPLEGLHGKTGAGVLETALAADSALHAADNTALFKTFTKVLAQRQGLLATFMAKWSYSHFVKG